MIKLTLIIQTEDCIRYSINESKVPYSFFYRLSTIFSPSSILLSSYDFLRVKFLELCSFCRRILKLPDGCKLHCWKHVLLQVIHISLKRPESDGKYNQLKPSPVILRRLIHNPQSRTFLPCLPAGRFSKFYLFSHRCLRICHRLKQPPYI